MNDLNDESKIDKKESPKKEEKKLSIEEQLKNSEDKLLRSLAVIENQRNRFEKVAEALDCTDLTHIIRGGLSNPQLRMLKEERSPAQGIMSH